MNNSDRIKTKELNENVVPIISFLCLLFFQILLNFGLNVPHSIPDEFGAMTLAANISGNDWSLVSEKIGLHYGFSTTLPFFFVFYIIKDPVILYKFMLAVGCLWRTLPVFVIFPIARDYLGIKDDFIIALMSVAAVLGTPTRGSTIDNEPMLILTAWLSTYLILKIIDSKSRKIKIRDMLLLLFVLAYSYTAHERSLVYIVAAFFTLLLNSVWASQSWKKSIKALLAVGFALAIISLLLTKFINLDYFVENGWTARNSLLSYLLSTSDRINELLTPIGLISFISLIISNYWGVFTYYCGMIGLAFIVVIATVTKKNIELTDKENAILKMSVYPLMACLFYLIGLGVFMNRFSVPTIENGEEISRVYFYLRYIGSTMGICLFLTIGYIVKHGLKKWYLIISLLSALISLGFTYNVSLKNAFEKGNYSGDFFNFFGPLSFSSTAVYYGGKTAKYYILATVISGLILMLVYVVSQKRMLFLIPMIISLVMIYQYSYMVIMCDLPSAQMYFSFADSLYEVKRDNPHCFDDVNAVYYCSQYLGLEPNSQMILNDITLIPEPPEGVSDNIVLLTNSEEYLEKTITFDIENLDSFCLDENETIYTNCESLKQCLSDYLNEE